MEGAVPNKTIYVSDDDLPLLEAAQRMSGANLSSTIALALQQFVNSAETARQGYREITVRVGGPGGTRRQRFRGRRLARWRHVAAHSRRAEVFAVYQTEKGRFAVHVQRGPEWLGWSDPEDEDAGALMLPDRWREHVRRLRASAERAGRSAPAGAERSLPPWAGRGAGWGAWREAWPTSGSVGDGCADGEAVLEPYESVDDMRERLPEELCDLVERALGTPEVEELDI